KKLELGLGMALGLFAIFGVLRYRTTTISAKQMTYLFIVIGIAVINSLSNKKTSYTELATVNCVIIAAAAWKERFVANGSRPAAAKAAAANAVSTRPPRSKHTVDYDRLDLLEPARRAELVADLQQRTGIAATDVQVRNIDLLNNVAALNVWYDDPNGNLDRKTGATS
ncbi:MAG: DUF4956 domain-containing protein, partial [Planctomycetota bacterium]